MRIADYITTVSGVQGGEPIVRGTRTPVRTVVVLFHQTYPGDKEAVQRAQPHLTRDEIDALGADHVQALERLTIAG